MLEAIGIALVWLVALGLLAAFPLSELARGTASNPDAHEQSGWAKVISLVGLALIAFLVFG